LSKEKARRRRSREVEVAARGEKASKGKKKTRRAVQRIAGNRNPKRPLKRINPSKSRIIMGLNARRHETAWKDRRWRQSRTLEWGKP